MTSCASQETQNSNAIPKTKYMSILTEFLNSISSSLTTPYSANCWNPYEAYSPSLHIVKLGEWLAPMTSEKCVNWEVTGKSFG